ncbi:ABC transporter ATP-binding protein [Salinactinospora qingdaonensis]|uniref:ABC transporter ATP-binding protein n=1 Tax=Salinactinospora qingdaonensis TaxID=702744 RepID=A0ABP7FEW0_9ACTN
MAVLEVRDLVKEYRRGVRANDGISLAVSEGEFVGLLGHNGAGKTTLLDQVVGLAKPTSGSIHVAGRDAVAEPAFARAACAVMPQAQAPLSGITPRQAITTMARIRGADKSRARERTNHLLSALDIEAWADTTGDRLSGGVRRLTAFGMAVVEPGRVVMLDEPTNDVDPVRRRLLWDYIRSLAGDGHAVLLVTHNVNEAERSTDRLVILDAGHVVAEGTPAELRARAEGELRLELTAATPESPLPQIETAGSPRRDGRRITMPITADHAEEALNRAQHLRANGDIEEFALTPVSLEDVYVGLVGTGGSNGDERAGGDGDGTPVSSGDEAEPAGSLVS